MRPALLFVAFGLAVFPAEAQELSCQVTLDRRSLSGSEYVFLDELRQEVERYVNGRAWTDAVVEPAERIDCQIQITVTEAVSLTSFQGQLVVQSTRPVYGTAQRSTTVLLSDDDWDFGYARGQALIYDPNRFDPLTSVLDFYALLLVGYDYDTFAPLGGTPYFERARRVAELALTTPSSDEWTGTSAEDRSRFTLVQELLDPVFLPLRQAHFDYHYTVLDHFVIQPQQAWEEALVVMASLNELYLQFNRRRYATDVFFGARYQEITGLFRDAPQRNQAYALLAEMDAAHLGTYDALVNG